MASRLLDRLKRSLFKDGQRVGHERDTGGGREQEAFDQNRWEAELEEEEGVTEQLGGMLRFDGRDGGEDGAEGDESGLDSDSDFLGESMEEGISSTGGSRSSLTSQQNRLMKPGQLPCPCLTTARFWIQCWSRDPRLVCVCRHKSCRRVSSWTLLILPADPAALAEPWSGSSLWEATDGRLAVRGDGRQRGARRLLKICGEFTRFCSGAV